MIKANQTGAQVHSSPSTRSTRRVASSLLPILLAAGCVRRDYNSTSEPAHVAQNPVFSVHKSQWTDSDPEAMKVQSLFFASGPKESLAELAKAAFYPQNHVVVKRYQAWLDRIDTALRASPAGERLKNTPRPKLIVRRADAIINANASVALICVTVPTVVDKAVQRNEKTAKAALLFMPGTGQVMGLTNVDLGKGPGCLPGGAASTDFVSDYLANYNEVAAKDSDCSAHFANGEVAFGKNCKLENLKGSWGADRLILPSTSNVLNLYSGTIVKSKNEQEVVAVLAHELTHYYRAHLAQPASRIAFIYEEDPQKPVLMPSPVHKPEFDELLNRLGDGRTVSTLRNVPGQRFNRVALGTMLTSGIRHTYLWIFSSTERLAQKLVASCEADWGKCGGACNDWQALLRQPTPPTGVDGWMLREAAILLDSEVLDSTRQQKYLEAERAFGKCAVAVSTSIYPLLGKIDTHKLFESAVLGGNHFAAGRESELLNARNVAEFVDKLSTIANAEAQKLQQAESEARSKNLGWYTCEQEADEMALELSAMIGLPPESLAGFVNGTMDTESDSLLNWPPEQCRVAMQQKFRGPDGAYTIPPFGDNADPHHNLCYRAFAIQRELDQHRYVVGAAPTTPLPGGSWTEFRTSQNW